MKARRPKGRMKLCSRSLRRLLNRSLCCRSGSCLILCLRFFSLRCCVSSCSRFSGERSCLCSFCCFLRRSFFGCALRNVLLELRLRDDCLLLPFNETLIDEE